MIPTTENDLQNDFEFEELPTNTYALQQEYSRIYGFTDGIEAMKQAIYLIINTERYEWLIYSWNYGVELADLFGQPISFCMAELERRIREALLQDTRITAVDGFQFDYRKEKRNTLAVRFTAHTVFGDIETEKVVEI